jgi:AcrR family transcriptional regulator
MILATRATGRATGSGELRRLILDRTRHLLVTDGYQNLSMRKIARAIGYSPTSIYLHFNNKDALFHALVEEGMEKMHRVLAEVAAEHTADSVARLGALCRAYIDFGLQNPEYYEIMFQLHPEEAARYPAEKYRRARRNLALIYEALADGVREGRMDAADAAVATYVIWAALHGTVSLLIARRVDVKVDAPALRNAVVEQTLRGYLVGEARADLMHP